MLLLLLQGPSKQAASRVSGQSPNPISRNVTMIGPILSCASGHRVPGRRNLGQASAAIGAR